MPIYHFNVFTEASGTSADWIGVDLPNDAAAEREAMRFAGITITDNATFERRTKEWHLEVTDYIGTPLFNLDFAMRPALSVSSLPHSRLSVVRPS